MYMCTSSSGSSTARGSSGGVGVIQEMKEGTPRLKQDEYFPHRGARETHLHGLQQVIDDGADADAGNGAGARNGAGKFSGAGAGRR